MTTNGPATVDVSALAEACEAYTAAYLSREEEVSPELLDDIRRALGGVTALSEEVARLTRERDEALADDVGNEATLDTVTRRLAEALNLDEVPLDEMLFMVGNIVDERHGSVIRSAVAALESAPEQVLVSRPAIPADRPRVVCLCGSMRFEEEIREAAREESIAGHIVVVSDASGYVGDSTRSEIAYAVAHGKPVRYWPAPVSGSDTTADGGDQ